jgi:hypothetical protein
MMKFNQIASRRIFLELLAASPLYASGVTQGFAQTIAPPLSPADPLSWAPRDLDSLIVDPKQAISVFDFEPVMRKNVPPAHFGYMEEPPRRTATSGREEMVCAKPTVGHKAPP